MNKSGLFTEFGKSVHGASYTVGGVKKSAARGKIEAAASEIMKSNKDLTYNQAIAKAWEDNPDIAMEYEAERSSNN